LVCKGSRNDTTDTSDTTDTTDTNLIGSTLATVLDEGLCVSRVIDEGSYDPNVIGRVGRHPLKPVTARFHIGGRDDTPAHTIPVFDEGLSTSPAPREIDTHGPDVVGRDSHHLVQLIVRPRVGAWDDVPPRAVPVLDKRGIINVIPIVGNPYRPGVLRGDSHYAKENAVVQAVIGAVDDLPGIVFLGDGGDHLCCHERVRQQCCEQERELAQRIAFHTFLQMFMYFGSHR
jgi:hypothetical protein